MADPISLAGMGLVLAARLANVIDNVERIHKAYKAGQDVPRQLSAVRDSCKTLMRCLEQHPRQRRLSKDLFQQVERMGEDIRELADKYCFEQTQSAASGHRTFKLVRRKSKDFGRVVDFRTDVLNTFTSAEQLLLKVLGLIRQDEVRQLTSHAQGPSVREHSQPSTSSGEDRWVGGKRSLPSKESFMLGPEKIQAIAELKRAVLARKTGGPATAVGVQGMSGLGKTTACLVVASDQDVVNVYGDAVLWMSLGIAVTADIVVDQLASVVESTGGISRASLMRDMYNRYGFENLDSIRDKARDWFKERRVLLVVDSEFPASKDSTPRYWVKFLRQVLGSESCLLFSTGTVEATGESDVQVPFEPLATLAQQKDVLLAHLGERDAELQSSQIETIVDLCCGLPIALATAAALVRRLNFNWLLIWRTLQVSIWDTPSHSAGSDLRFSARGGHDGLAAVFSLGLRVLNISSETSLHRDYSWTDLYLSLCFIDKSSARVPVGLLSILWGTDVYVAERICLGFQDMALGRLKAGSCTPSGTFEMHDLQLAYVAWRAGSKGFLDCQTTSGEDLLALSCNVEGTFEDIWDQMHCECGCTLQHSSAADLTLAREAVIWCYAAAVKVETVGTRLHERAYVHVNMGRAFYDRALGNRADNIERALACYQAALQTWTREAVPHDWERTQVCTGIAWQNRLLGDRADNIERALACYKNALIHWTREAVPRDWALVRAIMGGAWTVRVLGDRADNIERALVCCNDALRVRTRAAGPHEWATVQTNLGAAWQNRVIGDRAENIERALTCYKNALQVQTREAVPHEWARVQVAMGNAWAIRVMGDRADSIERALACYNDALGVWTRETVPHEWALVQMNLGNAWQNRVLGDRADNIERALGCYNYALQVRTREAMPLEWARTQMNLGIVWNDRVMGDRAGNVERAFTCYNAALQVWTREAAPHDWALVQASMGNAWSDRVLGARGDNTERALACYQGALEVLTREAAPQDWASVQMSMGAALCERVAGERADNIERALACGHDALQVWTREAAPRDWASVQCNMGVAWNNRALGEASDNRKRAIACYSEALKVFTPEAMPRECALVEENVSMVRAEDESSGSCGVQGSTDDSR